MQHIIYIDSAKHINIDNDSLVILSKEEERKSIHFEDISAVVFESSFCEISVPALLACTQKAIPLIFCNERHQPELYCLDLFRHTELLNRLNMQISWTQERKNLAWLEILKGKLKHQINLLKHLNKSGYEQIQAYLLSLNSYRFDETMLNTAESISARIYFNALFDNFKRFKPDVINQALNYGYAIIRSQIMIAITIKGLHPALGVWHHSTRNRFNLADDFIEVLRPLVDAKVKALNPQNEFTTKHKEELLSLLFADLYWQNKETSLKNAINFYVDDFIRFMNKYTEKFNIIEIQNSDYEPN